MEWKPIETAPKDDDVLVYCEFGIRVAWHSGAFWYVTGAHGDGDTIQPTHWMPLPEPPAVTIRKE